MRTEPRATYRVQLRREFNFDDCRAVLAYLAELGVSHLYCSPYLQASPGSAHGYDVVDPTRINSELGGDEGLARLDAELRRHGMGQLLDIVPNHMSVAGPENRWWWDVLRHGRASRYADFFDIDWDAPRLGGKVLLPVLGDELEAVLERGELQVAATSDGTELRYFDRRFPLSGEAQPGPATPALLREQHYLLEFWRSGLRRVNYRRFFDVATLAALRAELPQVFAATHERILQLVAEGVVDGLRVDHVDGLRDPGGYLRLLSAAAPGTWIVVEKILALDERLPEAWPVDGTTGYETAARIGEVLLDHDGAWRAVVAYGELTGDRAGFTEHSRAGREVVVRDLLSSELDRLARAAEAAGVTGAAAELTALLVAMPVYRLYPCGDAPLNAADRDALHAAAGAARGEGGIDIDKLDRIVSIIDSPPASESAAEELRVRFQQLSSAVMAKGVEDTAFYRHVPLVSLNEVGGDPGVLGMSDARFDELTTFVPQHATSLNATSTHDTKRGEDARIRVAMLAEAPDAWETTTRRLFALGAAHRGVHGPSRRAEFLLYETLIAAHPIDADRAVAYMRKAVREAKEETSWLEVNTPYEDDLEQFVRAVLDDDAMMREVTALLTLLTPAWQTAALTQTLLKLTLPGIADIYQGSELWDLRLVDPDNRTPVDYGLRHAALRRLQDMSVSEIVDHMEQGLPKLHLIHQALQLRARRMSAFAAPRRRLHATGSRAEHVIAHRCGDDVVTVGVRRPLRLGGSWKNTVVSVPPGGWHNLLDGADVGDGARDVQQLLAVFPVALLERTQ